MAGIKLNGDKVWLEGFLDEKFGRVEDKIDNINQSLQRHQNELDRIDEYVDVLKKEKDDCRANIIAKIEHLLGKDEGMNLISAKRAAKTELSLKKYTVYIAVITVILNILFWIGRNWIEFKNAGIV